MICPKCGKMMDPLWPKPLPPEKSSEEFAELC